MIKNKNIKQNIVNIVVCLICVSLIYCGSYITNRLSSMKSHIKSNIENEWRVQAKRSLSNIQDQFMYDADHGIVNPQDELSLQEWAKRNISGVLNGGNTGDTFMINLQNEKFIWDGSPDCAKSSFITNGRYMSDEADMHVDKEQAELELNRMRLGQSTLNVYGNDWWNFDGSPEYLEWIVIPPGFLGFDNQSSTVGGVDNTKYCKILIALGTQEDEVQSNFSNTFTTIDNCIKATNLFVILSLVICIFNMIIYVFLYKRK